MTDILVTGANGQLGQSLKRVFATDQNLHVVYIDIEDLDLTDIEAVTEYFNKNHFDIIINSSQFDYLFRYLTTRSTREIEASSIELTIESILETR